MWTGRALGAGTKSADRSASSTRVTFQGGAWSATVSFCTICGSTPERSTVVLGEGVAWLSGAVTTRALSAEVLPPALWFAVGPFVSTARQLMAMTPARIVALSLVATARMGVTRPTTSIGLVGPAGGLSLRTGLIAILPDAAYLMPTKASHGPIADSVLVWHGRLRRSRRPTHSPHSPAPYDPPIIPSTSAIHSGYLPAPSGHRRRLRPIQGKCYEFRYS